MYQVSISHLSTKSTNAIFSLANDGELTVTSRYARQWRINNIESMKESDNLLTRKQFKSNPSKALNDLDVGGSVCVGIRGNGKRGSDPELFYKIERTK